MLRKLLRIGRRCVLAAALATSAGVIASACSDGTATAVPVLELSYAPNPPVAGQPLRLTIEGKNLGAIDVFQGTELLARIVNPLVNDVPKDFFVFTAKSADPPRALIYDGDGHRTEVKGEPDGPAAPPGDAGKVDSGPPIVDAGVDAAPPEYAETCPGVGPSDTDAGPICGKATVLGFLYIKNGRAADIRLQESYFSDPQTGGDGSCGLRPLRTVQPNTVVNANVTDNQSVFVYEADGTTLVEHIRIEPGAASSAAPCKLLIAP